MEEEVKQINEDVIEIVIPQPPLVERLSKTLLLTDKENLLKQIEEIDIKLAKFEE